MSIKYPLTLILSCFLLGACSDKGFNPSEKYKDSAVDSTVSDAEDLPECTDSREGLVILVQTEKSVFVCAQEAWAQIRTIPSVDTVASSVVDSRDGQSYEVVTIGSQVWMAENLNYETDSSRVNSDCYDYDYKCGRYYTWEDASGDLVLSLSPVESSPPPASGSLDESYLIPGRISSSSTSGAISSGETLVLLFSMSFISSRAPLSYKFILISYILI